MNPLMPALCMVHAAIAAAFVTHQHQQLQLHQPLLRYQQQIFCPKPLHSTTTNDFDLPVNQELKASTTEVKTTPIELLSSDERNRIDQLVNSRSEARWSGDYAKADELRNAIDNTHVVIPLSRILEAIETEDKDVFSECSAEQQDIVSLEYKVMVTDIPRSEGGGSQWELTPSNDPLVENFLQESDDNLLQLAHAALGMAVSASERGVDVDKVILSELVGRAEARLRALKQRKAMSIFFPGAAAAAGELHGRKAADAILWFALAGVGSKEHSMDMYNDLVDIATEELQRFGMNSSCRAKDVLHIVERVAMAGIISESSNRLYRVAADCLEAKMMSSKVLQKSNSDEEDDGSSIDYGRIIQSLRDSSFGLHSDRTLLNLWRFSTRQRKQRAFFANAARHFESSTVYADLDVNSENSTQYDWASMFKDPSRPLVVDVGCGMGVSLLGLASFSNGDNQPSSENDGIDWSECNFIGVDLSRLTLGYAQSVCSRWSLDYLSFVVDPAEDCLARIRETYPGPVELVMLQFPTPYRFESKIEEDDEGSTDDSMADTAPSVAKRGFNSQLPEGAASDDFMVTKRLLSQIHNVLSKSDGQLLIQSNCEDVAVHMRNVASAEVGFESVAFDDSVTSLGVATQRAQRWVEAGGERAVGKYWSAEPLLPLKGRTETEVACLLDCKPVHRCLLKAS